MRNMIFALLAVVSTNVWATDDEASFASFDNIVNELKTSADEKPRTHGPQVDFDWDEVAIHGGIALSTSYVSVTSPDGIEGAGLLKGFQLDFGMNLFTRRARAEGAFSSYRQEELDNNLRADLKQFDLRLVFLPLVDSKMAVRLGTGIAARYLSLESRTEGRWKTHEASTPSSIFLFGFERRVTPNVALGPDVSYRSAIVSDTYDKSAWDAAIRLNATF